MGQMKRIIYLKIFNLIIVFHGNDNKHNSNTKLYVTSAWILMNLPYYAYTQKLNVHIDTWSGFYSGGANNDNIKHWICFLIEI